MRMLIKILVIELKLWNFEEKNINTRVHAPRSFSQIIFIIQETVATTK